MATVMTNLKSAKGVVTVPGQAPSGALAGDKVCAKTSAVPAGQKLGSAAKVSPTMAESMKS